MRIKCELACGLLFAIALMVFMSGCDQRPVKTYKINFIAARELVYSQNTAFDVDELRVYVSSSKNGFDSYSTLKKIMGEPIVYQTKELGAISNAIATLRDERDYAGLETSTGKIGKTVHLLLINNRESQVIQFRIFMPEKISDSRLWVFPRSDTKFSYANSKILPWLHDLGIGF